jgi:SWI/SNF-related matrix-associated actin-dependent regulator of chromatin subfamily A3
MGLGKTIQALALILSNPPAAKAMLDPFVTLIVAPKSAMPNWVQQTEEHVKKGNLKTVIYEGAKREEMVRRIHKREWNIVIVSYETMAADYKNHMKAESDDDGLPPPPTLFALNFHRVILDEAHTIRNPTTKTFHAAVNVKAVHKLALTGTPFVNSVSFVLILSTTFHH